MFVSGPLFFFEIVLCHCPDLCLCYWCESVCVRVGECTLDMRASQQGRQSKEQVNENDEDDDSLMNSKVLILQLVKRNIDTVLKIQMKLQNLLIKNIGGFVLKEDILLNPLQTLLIA